MLKRAFHRRGATWLALLATATLAACGDGGGGTTASTAPVAQAASASNSSSSSTTGAPVATPSTNTSGSALLISGSPSSVVSAGAVYSFTPSATNTAGSGTLVYSISNKPAWATFSNTNGTLTGVPNTADVGTYASIVISVSNGLVTASLPAFAISVNASQAALGSATLRWVAPTQTVDGAPLTNLAGYRIYWGTSPTNLSQLASINDAAATSYQVNGLTTGTWYFTVRAFDSANVEGASSNVASKTI